MYNFLRDIYFNILFTSRLVSLKRSEAKGFDPPLLPSRFANLGLPISGSSATGEVGSDEPLVCEDALRPMHSVFYFDLIIPP